MTTSSSQSPQDTQSAIARHPLTVTPDTTVKAAIAKMAETGSDYVLVVESLGSERNTLIGILTERDLVRISIQPIPLDQLPVEAVMSHPVITIEASTFTDINTALALFQQHRIRHLPVLDDGDRLIGLLDRDALVEILMQRVLQLESEPGTIANITEIERGEATLQQLNQDLEKQVEEQSIALQVSEATNRIMLEAIPDLLLRLQRDGTCSDYIKSGTRAENFLPIINHISEILPPDLLQKQLEIIDRAIVAGGLHVYEHSFFKQGCLVHEEVRILAINDREVLAIIRDISDRKLSEQDLHLSDERLQLVLGIAGDGLWDWNIDTGSMYFNSRWWEMLGFSPDDLPANIATWKQLLHPDDKPWVMERLNAHFQDASVAYRFDYRLKTKSGEYCWIANYGKVVIRDPQGKPLRMIGTHRDLTARKEAEEQLRKRDVHLKTAQYLGKFGNWEFELSTGKISWSDEVFRTFRRDPAMGTPTYEELKQYVYPDDWDLFDQTLQTAIALVQPYELEYRIRRPGGSVAYFVSRAEIIRNDLGQLVQLIGTLLDVTNLKRAEAELRQLNQDLEHRVEIRTASLQRSEDRLREAQQVAHLGDWELDLRTHTLSWSPEVFKIFGLDPSQPEPTYEEMLAYYPVNERKRVNDFVDRAIQGEIAETDFQIIRADGSSAYTFSRAETIRDESGQAIGLFGIVMDISDRKVIQEALERNEERACATLLALPDLVFRVNHHGQYIDFLTSPQGKNLVDPDLSYGKSIYDLLSEFITPNHAETKYSALKLAIATQTVQTYEQQVWVDGTLRDEEVRVAPCGKDEAVFFVRDISDRKQIEKSLRESQQFIQTVVNTVPLPLFWKDRDSVFLGCNQQFANTVGLSSPAEIIGKTDFDIVSVEAEAISYRLRDREVMEFGKARLGIEELLTLPDGKQSYVESYKAPMRDGADNIIGVVGILQDVTARKQAELSLQQQLKQEHLLGEITQRMRSSLNLIEILRATVEEVHQILQSDRVLVYRVLPDGRGTAIAESVSPNCPQISNSGFPDNIIPPERYALYVQGKVFICCDSEVEKQLLFNRLVEFLVEIQVKAAVVVPIIQNQTIWGFLVPHQCDRPRQWQDWEINLLEQTANQLAVAIQQASLFEQLQQELADREQAKQEIALQLRRQQALGAIAQRIRESLDVGEILVTVTQQIKDVMECDRVIVFQLSPNGITRIVEEAVSIDLVALKEQNWDDEVWGDELLDYYWQGKPRIVSDVMDDIWTYCLKEYSIEGQIQSKIIAPILQDVDCGENHRWVCTEKSIKIWGVLVVHACREKRVWQESEAQLLQQIANQLAIAIQQASLFERSQTELVERQRAETLLIETNARLAITNSELVRATRLKDEFLANMSHELRTPLNAILGMTEGLQEQVFGPMNAPQLKALQTVERSGFHLLELIDDILDMAKIEAGQVKLDCSPISVSHLCQSSMTFIKQQALRKQIQLDIKLPPNLPDLVVDERRIRQVLINLLSNAVKFTPEKGRITLEVTIFCDADSTDPLQRCLQIAAIDTGIGIAPENIDKLFQPFIQIDSALNRQYNGTGLGLALVKRIVELHEGSVSVTSKIGVGSCFTIKLPYASTLSSNFKNIEGDTVATSPPELLLPTTAIHSPLVLLAEDNEANISTFSSYLKAKGYDILLAKNGQDAIALAKTHQPDLILMDIQMPIMDGMEATRQIRLDPNLVNIPIIALTALAMTGDRDRCLQAGANEYLTKPVKLNHLATTIHKFLNFL